MQLARLGFCFKKSHLQTWKSRQAQMHMGKNMNTCTYIDMLYIVVLQVHKHVQERKNEYSLSSLNKIWTSQNLPARVLHFLQLLNPLHLLLGLHVSAEKKWFKIISRWIEKHISYMFQTVQYYIMKTNDACFEAFIKRLWCKF